MKGNKIVGVLILVASVFGILVYGWLLFFSSWSILVLELTAFTALSSILAILAWIGYTFATTEIPESLRELADELGPSEIEQK